MIFITIIFFISLIVAFGMLLFREWEIRTLKISPIESDDLKFKPELSFRRIEKIILYITKHTIQWIIVFSIKIWFLITTKIKILFKNKLPKINKYFKKKENNTDSRKISFVERAVMESKIKISKVKEKIKKEHEEKEVQREKDNEVDKII